MDEGTVIEAETSWNKTEFNIMHDIFRLLRLPFTCNHKHQPPAFFSLLSPIFLASYFLYAML